MPARDPYNNISPSPPKMDTSKLEELAKENSNKELLEILIKMVEKLSIENKIDVRAAQAPNVSINMDVDKIVRSIPEPKAPVVNVNTESFAELMTKDNIEEPYSYSFNVERDGHGRIKKVIANRLGK